MKYIFIAFCILYLFSSFTRGVGMATLSGRSASGRTVFNAELESYVTLEKAELVIDNEKIKFTSGDRCYVTFDADDKVFTLHLESEANGNFDTLRYAELWAVPSSFKEISTEGTSFSVLYTFTARLKARDPRKGKYYNTPLITLDCKLGYTNP